MMAAQRYYVEKGDDLKDVVPFLTSWLPEVHKKEQLIGHWVDKVNEVLQTDILKSKTNTDSLKADVVTFAKNKWFSMFSRFYDANKIQGPDTSWSNVIMGLNFKGIQVMDEEENIKIRLPFIEIGSVLRGR